MVERMSELADELVVLAQPADPEFVTQLKNVCGAEFIPTPLDRTGLNPLKDRGYRKQLSSFLEDFQPDHTFAFQAKAAMYSSIAAKRYPKITTTVLFPGLGYLFSESGTLKDKVIRRLGWQMYRYAFNKVDNFIFQNPDDIETLVAAGIVKDRSKVNLVNGSGVPLEEYPFSPPVTKPIRFLFMGRLLWEKGVREFAEAAKRIREEVSDEAEFQILGPLDSNPSAISKAELDDVCESGGVEYLGVTQDVRPFLAKTSVFVLPSWYMEGTPRSILESMSMGRPIITADSRGCREPVEHGVNGFLVSPQDSGELFEAMKRFIEKPDLLGSMGRASREIAEDRYDVAKVNESIMSAMGLID